MSRPIYRFADCIVDLGARELRRDGKLLTLSPKVFDCIAYLIERRERAIGRDELIAAVWGRADVADVQLSYLMRKIRHTLGDSGDGQTTIRTIPRFGFRWVADTRTEEVSVGVQHEAAGVLPFQNTPEPSPIAEVTKSKDPYAPTAFTERRHAAIWPLVSLAILALGATAYAWRDYYGRSDVGIVSRMSTDTIQVSKSVAVLPVTTITDNADTAWMSLGLMDLIASRLREGGVVVVPSSDIVALAHGEGSGSALADKVRAGIGVKDVIATSAYRVDDGWTLQLELSTADGQKRNVTAHSADVIIASLEASSRLLDLLGKHPKSGSTQSTELSATQLFQRIEAALLVDDFSTARQLIDAAPPTFRDLPEAQLDEARVELGADHIEVARKGFESLLGKIHSETDPIFYARVLNGLGAALIDMNQLPLAERRYTESIAVLENQMEPAILGRAYNGRGVTHFAQGRLTDASADYGRARIAFEIVDDSLSLAQVDSNEAAVDVRNSHPASALPLLERAVQRLEPFGALDQSAYAIINEIFVQLALLEPAKALAVSDAVGSRFDHFQKISTLHVLRFAQAKALAANGRLTEAQAIFSILERTVSAASDGRLLAAIQGEKAALALADDHVDSAASLAKTAVDTWLTVKFPHECSTNWVTWIRALRKLNRNAEAAAELHRFSTCASGADDPIANFYVRILEAEGTWGKGKRKQAVELYDEAVRSAHQFDVPMAIADAAISYGNALLSVNETPSAVDVTDQIARWAESDFRCAVLRTRMYRALGQHDAWEAALTQARALAGERPIPLDISLPPPERIAQLP